MSYLCEICNKRFTKKQSLKRHVDTINIHKKYFESVKHYVCNCGHEFLHRQSLHAHKQHCTVKNEPELDIVQILNNTFDKERVQFEKEAAVLREQIDKLLEKNSGNTIIENQQVENQQIHIHINAFGRENLDYITDQMIVRCVGNVYKSIPSMNINNEIMIHIKKNIKIMIKIYINNWHLM